MITAAAGTTQLGFLSFRLRRLCDKCCICSCSPEECKQEANAIGAAIAQAWQTNFGQGSAGGQAVGGYMCWDWARFFRDAANSEDPKCWSATIRQVWGGPGNQTHYFLELAACGSENGSEECKLYVDDDAFNTGTLIHSGTSWLGGYTWEDNPIIPPFTPESWWPKFLHGLGGIPDGWPPMY